MKHAICILGSGDNSKVIQSTIHHLDDGDIDFFVHWDLKDECPSFDAVKSRIIYLSDQERIDVKWGQYSQIEAELALLRKVENASIKYDYVHLISSSDIPLMDVDYFKSFFQNGRDMYLDFNDWNPEGITERIKFYYPIEKINIRNHRLVIPTLRFINWILHVDRLKHRDIRVRYGSNWFSMNSQFLAELLNADLSIYKHGFCVDELFVQTTLNRFYTPQNDSNNFNARYIRWEGGSHPHTFTLADIEELKRVKNTNYAFCRKVTDPNLLQKLFG